MAKQVMLIDDDELFRAGLTCLIDSFDGFEVRMNVNSTDFMASDKMPDADQLNLILLSPPAPVAKGVAVCEKATQDFPNACVMVFSNAYSKFVIIKAIEFGISAYFTKEISPYELEDVMKELTAADSFSDIKLEPQVRNALIREELTEVDFTTGEKEVLNLVCEQKSSSEISEDLGISVRTVESRKRNMMLKTKSKNMIGVVLRFLETRQK